MQLQPLLLRPTELRLTPEQFALVCQANPDAVLELGSSGQLIRQARIGGEASTRNAALLFALHGYAKRMNAWKAFGSSSGFRLPDGSVLSASLVRLERWQTLSPEQRRPTGLAAARGAGRGDLGRMSHLRVAVRS